MGKKINLNAKKTIYKKKIQGKNKRYGVKIKIKT